MRKPYWLVLVCAWGAEARSADPKAELPALEWPTVLSGARISQEFGVTARQPGRSFSNSIRHAGIDIHVPAGSPVYAAESGIVRRATSTYLPKKDVGEYLNARKALVIEHKHGTKTFVTSYGHVNFSVQEGAEVKRGKQIGTVADWGKNTHLHYSIRAASYDSDPRLAILGRGNAEEMALHVDPMGHYVKHASKEVADQLQEAFGTTKTPGKDRIARRIGLDAGNTEPQPEPTPPRPQPNRLPGFEDPKGRFRITVPPEWTVDRRQRNTAYIQFLWGPPGPNNGARGYLSITLTSSIQPFDKVFRRYEEAAAASLSEMSAPVRVKVGKDRLDGIRIGSPRRELVHEATVVFAPSGCAHISCFAYSASDLETFRRVVDTIEFTKGSLDNAEDSKKPIVRK